MHLIVLIIVAALSSTSAEPYDVKKLIQEANRLGAPFTTKSLEKLHSRTWESARANHSTNVVIFNTASESFHLKRNFCSFGSPSSGLLPELNLVKDQSVVHGFQSRQKEKALVCLTVYQSENRNSWFTMTVANSYYTGNAIYVRSSSDLSVSATLGHGSNNQVRFVIGKRNRRTRALSGKHGGGYGHQITAEVARHISRG